MNTKTYGIALIVILLAVALYFGLARQANIFPALNTGKSGWTITQSGSSSDYYSYSMHAEPYYNYATTNAQKEPSTINPPLNQPLVWDTSITSFTKLPSDIQFGQSFPAQVQPIGPTAGYFPNGYGYATSEVPVTIQNLTATCIADSSSSVTCNVKGIVFTADPSIQPTETNGIRIGLLNAGFNLQTNFYKQGHSLQPLAATLTQTSTQPPSTSAGVSNSVTPASSSTQSGTTSQGATPTVQNLNIFQKIWNWITGWFTS